MKKTWIIIIFLVVIGIFTAALVYGVDKVSGLVRQTSGQNITDGFFTDETNIQLVAANVYQLDLQSGLSIGDGIKQFVAEYPTRNIIGMYTMGDVVGHVRIYIMTKERE